MVTKWQIIILFAANYTSIATIFFYVRLKLVGEGVSAPVIGENAYGGHKWWIEFPLAQV